MSLLEQNITKMSKGTISDAHTVPVELYMCLQIRHGEQLHQLWLLVPKDQGSQLPSDVPPPALPGAASVLSESI